MKKTLEKSRKFLEIPGVVGIGIGKKITRGRMTDENCITVLVEKKKPESILRPEHVVPKKIGKVLTDVIEVGKLKALLKPLKPKKKEAVRTAKLRPFPMGVSIGNYKITAGTAGMIVYPRDDFEQMPSPTPFKRNCILVDLIRKLISWLKRLFGFEKIKAKEVQRRKFILSNNHVLAASQMEGEPNIIGDYICQPGKYDDPNWQKNVIGRLYSYIPLKRSGNTVDCAIASLDDESVALNEILDVGVPKGIASVNPGDKVFKSGRTTGLNYGRVLTIHSTVQVDYEEKGVLEFNDCIVTTYMSEGGDSGSAGLTEGNKVFGLLFAGSSRVTIFCDIRNVFEALRVKL